MKAFDFEILNFAEFNFDISFILCIYNTYNENDNKCFASRNVRNL